MLDHLVIVGGKAGAHLAFEYSNYKKTSFFNTFSEKVPEKDIIKSEDEFLDAIINKKVDYFIAAGDNQVRQSIFNDIVAKTKIKPVNIIHQSCIVENGVKLGKGLLICPGAIININTTIGDGAIINTNATIEHDCECKKFSQISPGATLAGYCKVGERSFIGTNATLLPNIYVENDVMVGAGSVVTKNVTKNKTVKGNPAK